MTRFKILNRNTAVAPGKYRHFKGQHYQVLGIARHSETLDEFVIYKALYKNKTSVLWVRPKTMFLETVKVEGQEVPRFEKLKAGRKPKGSHV